MGRDTPRSDAIRQLWRAAEGFGREHGEHGEDPPLARSEHCGICAGCLQGAVIHSGKVQFLLKFRFMGSQDTVYIVENEGKYDQTGG